MALLWWAVALVLSGLLAVTIGRAGWIKTFTPLVSLAGAGLVWVREIPAWSVRTIGILELAAACIIVAAPVMRFVTGPNAVLMIAGVAAALGVATLMAAAHLFHRSRGESQHTWKTNLAFGSLAIMTGSAQFIAG